MRYFHLEIGSLVAKVETIRNPLFFSSPLFSSFYTQKKTSNIILRILKLKKGRIFEGNHISPELIQYLSYNYYPFNQIQKSHRNFQERIKTIINGGEEISFQIGKACIMFSFYKESKGDLIYTSQYHYSADTERISLILLCEQLLPKFNATLLHSAGVVRNKKADIFLAPSMGGKTTVTELAKGSFILSDDQTLLRKIDGEFFAFSTPFGRRTSGFKKVKPGGFFFLKKSKSFSLSRLKPMDALARAWYSHRFFWQKTSPLARNKVFSLWYELFKGFPSYEMEFTKEFIDWDEIDRVK